MRLVLGCVALLGAVPLVACTVTTTDTDSSPDEPRASMSVPAPAPAPARSSRPAPKPLPAEPPAPAPAEASEFPEVVYVFMTDGGFGHWMCTGTLVSPRTVVTAAHCIDPAVFTSYEIVAPGAPGAPHVAATDPKVFGGPYDDVANPDVGVLRLTAPLDLPVYAELTDVVSHVDAGEALVVAAFVRVDEQAEAPFAWSDDMPLSSTVGFGYEHGFGTPMFSKGGDSGAGLFLVEDGVHTHKLVGVARQPEPERDLDHFTRIDASFMKWFSANTK